MTRVKSIGLQHVRPLMISVASVFSLFNTNAASAVCTVSIGGGTPTINVGQRSDFTSTVTGGGTPVSYQWSVSGGSSAILRDYRESTQAPWSTTQMAAGDFQRPTISFYWKPPTQNRTVTVNVRAGADTCSASRAISVVRNNTDITRQAEDFYLSNHGGLALNEHRAWHTGNNFTTAGYDGSLFFDFHRAYIARFDSWRREFGYPTTVVWNSGTSIPTGVPINHSPRNASYTLTPKPTWFTIAGGTLMRPSNGQPCDSGGGQNGLSDFASLDHLGCAVTTPYHNLVHTRVGGDMRDNALAPRDPLFWRWHLFVDTIARDWPGPGVSLATTEQPSFIDRIMRAFISPAAAGPTTQTLDVRPPEVIYQAPFRLFRYITALPSVAVTFSEPVTGVIPSDLTVNGSAATEVTGEQAGPYVFTGYAPPAQPQIKVEVKGSGIQDVSGNAFAGNSWQYHLVKRGVDTDGDGINDSTEANKHRTNPLDADTDQDGLRDDFEIMNPCLDPLTNQTHQHDMSENPIPGDEDADDDGLSDLEEFAEGINPCGL